MACGFHVVRAFSLPPGFFFCRFSIFYRAAPLPRSPFSHSLGNPWCSSHTSAIVCGALTANPSVAGAALMKQNAETDVDLAADPEGRRGVRVIAQMPRKIVFAAVVDTFRLIKVHGTLCFTALVSMGIRAFLRADVFITGQTASLCAGPAPFLIL